VYGVRRARPAKRERAREGKEAHLLADLGRVAVLEDLQVAHEATRLERRAVPCLAERQAEDDVVAHRGVLKPRLLRDEGDVRRRDPVVVGEVGVPGNRGERDGAGRGTRARDRARKDVDLAEKRCGRDEGLSACGVRASSPGASRERERKRDAQRSMSVLPLPRRPQMRLSSPTGNSTSTSWSSNGLVSGSSASGSRRSCGNVMVALSNAMRCGCCASSWCCCASASATAVASSRAAASSTSGVSR